MTEQKDRMAVYSLRLSTHLRESLAALAQQKRMTPSTLVRKLITDYAERKR